MPPSYKLLDHCSVLCRKHQIDDTEVQLAALYDALVSIVNGASEAQPRSDAIHKEVMCRLAQLNGEAAFTRAVRILLAIGTRDVDPVVYSPGADTPEYPPSPSAQEPQQTDLSNLQASDLQRVLNAIVETLQTNRSLDQNVVKSLSQTVSRKNWLLTTLSLLLESENMVEQPGSGKLLAGMSFQNAWSLMVNYSPAELMRIALRKGFLSASMILWRRHVKFSLNGSILTFSSTCASQYLS